MNTLLRVWGHLERLYSSRRDTERASRTCETVLFCFRSSCVQVEVGGLCCPRRFTASGHASTIARMSRRFVASFSKSSSFVKVAACSSIHAFSITKPWALATRQRTRVKHATSVRKFAPTSGYLAPVGWLELELEAMQAPRVLSARPSRQVTTEALSIVSEAIEPRRPSRETAPILGRGPRT